MILIIILLFLFSPASWLHKFLIYNKEHNQADSH